MLHKSRIGAKRKRSVTQRGPSHHLAQMLFRLGEFGAIGLLIFAVILASKRPLQSGLPIDVYVFGVGGVASFLVGWGLRWLLTGNRDLS